MGNFSSKLLYNDSNDEIKVKSQCTSLPLKSEVSLPLTCQKTLPDYPSMIADLSRTPIENEKTGEPYLQTKFDIEVAPITNGHWLDPRSPSVVYPRTPILIQSSTDSISKKLHACNEVKSKICETKETTKNELDPRSPTIDFDRTPILKIKSLPQRNLRRLKNNNSNLDICIRLSYCETTNFYNISEIQALPDIAVSLKRSCSINEKLGKLNLSSVTDDFSTDDLNNIDTDLKLVSEKLSINKGGDEKFVIWRDLHSPKLFPTSINENMKRDLKILSEKEKVLIEFDDSTKIDCIQKECKTVATIIKESDHSNEKIKERISEKIGKRKHYAEKEIKAKPNKKLIDMDSKNMYEKFKNRTPLGNRSNDGQIQTPSMNSPQQILRNKTVLMRNLQENAPPISKRKMRNDKTKPSGTTNWDLDSTIFI